MAVVITKSAGITNRDASPQVKNNPPTASGNLRETVGYVPVASGDSIGSKYIFCRVPSNARISQVLLYSTKIGAATAADIGVYLTVPDGGTVVNASFFAAAQNLNAAAIIGLDIAHAASGANGLNDAEMPLWLALGLAVDPSVHYDIVATVTTAADANGQIVLKVRYVQ